MELIELKIKGVCLISPKVFVDERGYFYESYQFKRYSEIGIEEHFVQDNISFSQKGVIRGLHYQLKYPQAKLVSCSKGEIFDVVVDLRKNSPTFMNYVSCVLNGQNKNQLFIPKGCAHGFMTLSHSACFFYKCSDYYYLEDDYGISWKDETLDINWPTIDTPVVLSEKDFKLPTLKELKSTLLPDL